MDSRDSNKGAWIFVSHSNRDIEKVREIRNELEQRGHNPVLFYLKCMEVTEADDKLLWQLIEREIQAREWFVLCDSQNARSSPAVRREMELVRSMANEGKVVEVVHLDGDLQNEIRKVIGLSKRCTVFLSYSHRDSLIAEQIRHSLEQHGFSVWIDRDSLGAGNDWQKSIQSGMDEAIARGFVLLLLSPASLNSEFVSSEIEYALSRLGNIIPVIVESIHPEMTRPAISYQLRQLQWFDLTTGPFQERVDELIRNLKTREME
jgi:hypothetical protein